ncbi:MAG: NADH-quinone oxidoreductase subunit M [Candidatus Acidiferrales bacterium]
MDNQSYLLTVIIFFPTLGALAVLLLNGNDHVWIRRLALVVSLAQFVLSLLMLRAFNPADPRYQLVERSLWIDSPPIHYHLGVDGISLFLVLLTTFLTPLAILASWRGITTRVKEFHIMLLLLETGMVGVFLAWDLFLFFVFWEVMLIPMYFLIGVWGHQRRIYAAIKFVLYTMAGSILMLVAILWLYNATGTFDLIEIQGRLQAGGLADWTRTKEIWLFLAFFIAFAIKVPLFPLHTWLPDAHVEAPTAGSVILAGVLLKMGTYGLLRFCLPLFPEASRVLAPWIATLAIIAVIYGALVAMVQPDYKKLVAYSSVSHMGMVVLGIFAFNVIGIQGAMFQMLAHGVSTGGLFLVAGMLYDRRHTHMISEFGGLAKPMPRISAFLLFISLSSLGLPLLNGFVGEFLILAGTFRANKLWATLAATGVILSAVYLLWSYQRLVFGKVTNEKNASLPDADLRERIILTAVCIVILAMGVASPLITTRTEASAGYVLKLMERPGAYLATDHSGDPRRAAGATLECGSEAALFTASRESVNGSRPEAFTPSTNSCDELTGAASSAPISATAQEAR